MANSANAWNFQKQCCLKPILIFIEINYQNGNVFPVANVIQGVQKVTVHLSLSALFLDNQRFSFLVFRL